MFMWRAHWLCNKPSQKYPATLRSKFQTLFHVMRQAHAAEGELAAAVAARDTALLEARHAAEAAAGAAATAARQADALRAGAGAEREQALAALQARPRSSLLNPS